MSEVAENKAQEAINVPVRNEFFGYRVLVLDDDPCIIEFHNKVLSKLGFHCDNAMSIGKSLSYIDLQAYDLIISDFALPDGCGSSLIKEIRRRKISTPIVVVSGSPLSKILDRLSGVGFFSLIAKPFTASALEFAIRELLKEPTREPDLT